MDGLFRAINLLKMCGIRVINCHSTREEIR
jgi:hypothetical protein